MFFLRNIERAISKERITYVLRAQVGHLLQPLGDMVDLNPSSSDQKPKPGQKTLKCFLFSLL
jgi:hypothetical protein